MQVLVTAASKHGSTAEIADHIAAVIRRHGVSVTVAAPNDVSDLAGYDAVVLGSAVYAGHWLEPARRLAARTADALRSRPVWLFSSGPVGDPLRPAEAPVDVAGLVELTGAVQHQVFGGRIDRTRLGLAERALVKAMRVPEGNFCDATAVERWATAIARSLGTGDRNRA